MGFNSAFKGLISYQNASSIWAYVASITGTIYRARVLPIVYGASSSFIGFLEAVNSFTYVAQPLYEHLFVIKPFIFFGGGGADPVPKTHSFNVFFNSVLHYAFYRVCQ